MEQFLEINLISAQDLKQRAIYRGNQTYALVWVDDPSKKCRTGTDCSNAGNPTWNDKFLFRVPSDFVNSATAGFNVEIYSLRRHLKDSLIGTARCLLSSCLGKFTSVYIQRPSGNFQGILNVAAALSDAEDMGIFRGSPTVNFHDLTRGKSGERKKKKSLLGRLKLVKSSPSLSTMASSSTFLRPVKSDPSISTMISSTDWSEATTLRTSISLPSLSTLCDDSDFDTDTDTEV